MIVALLLACCGWGALVGRGFVACVRRDAVRLCRGDCRLAWPRTLLRTTCVAVALASVRVVADGGLPLTAALVGFVAARTAALARELRRG